MRYITEQELRDAFAEGIPERYLPPPEAKLTPAARQYLMDLRLYQPKRTVGVPFGPGQEKPENMTHLDGRTLVRKDHPRIVLRGRMDSLEASILMVQISATRQGDREAVRWLEDALLLVRRALASDYKQAPLDDWTLDGLSPAAVREASHHPERLLPGGHVLPSIAHGEIAALLNRLRTETREVEVQAIAAYSDAPCACGDAIILALNRLSSYFYVLQLRVIAQQEKAHGT